MNLNMSLKSTWKLARTEERAGMVWWALMLMLGGCGVIGVTVNSQRDVALLLNFITTMVCAANGLQVIRRDIVIRLLVIALQRQKAQQQGVQP